MSERWKCSLCEAAFDREQERDLHEATEAHCRRCHQLLQGPRGEERTCAACLAELDFMRDDGDLREVVWN